MQIRTLMAVVAATTIALAGCGSDDTSSDGAAADASVSFGGVSDGDTVTSPVAVDFEATGLEVVPAGSGGEGTGHMHVMVDVGCVTPGETIPSDDSHIHYGDGSTSAELDLEPGEHTLCLQAGDSVHTALDITEEISLTVEG